MMSVVIRHWSLVVMENAKHRDMIAALHLPPAGVSGGNVSRVASTPDRETFWRRIGATPLAALRTILWDKGPMTNDQ
jgi:hypothetical protein